MSKKVPDIIDNKTYQLKDAVNNIHQAFSEGINKGIIISGRTSPEEILS